MRPTSGAQHAGDAAQHSSLPAISLEVFRRERQLTHAAVRFSPEDDEPILVGDREWMTEDRVRDREDGDGESDAEGEDGDRAERERRRVCERAGSKANVASESGRHSWGV